MLCERVAVAELGDRAVELAGEVVGQDDIVALVLRVTKLDERSVAIWIPGQGAELETGLHARHRITLVSCRADLRQVSHDLVTCGMRSRKIFKPAKLRVREDQPG